jgi:protein Jumonji
LSQDSTKTPEKKSKLSKMLEKKVQPATTSKAAMTKLTPIPMPETKSSTKAQKQSLVSEIKPLPQAQVATPPPVATATTTQQVKDTLQLDRKPIYNQRRPAVYKPTPQPAAPTPPPKAKPTPKAKPAPAKPVAKYLVPVKQFGAFSPENEHSVYSFDKEDDALPVTTPFRQRKGGGKDNADDSGSGTTFQKPQSSNNTTPAKKPDQQEVSLTLSPEDHSKSASILVSGPTTGITNSTTVATTSRKLIELGEMGGVNFGGSKMMVMDDNDSDGSEGHTFYIPLQGASTATGSKSEQLIQGVKVKLGTEGPEGPNQRVIMHAKLVTKAQMGTNTTPIPESMANVQEIVKTLMAGKELTSKSVPVGTVQPRFKSGHDGTAEQPPASTSTAAAGPTLSRMNSTSSLSSVKQQQKYKNEAAINPNNITAFPRRDDPAQMVEAPIFRPTDKEFQDPIEYFERIAPVAARFGICKIIPPDSFKPECKVSDEMRFTAYNQYVHKMLHRWGPSAKELAAIKKYLVTQSIELQTPPLIGGMEVDLPRLYHTVQELGGLKEVIEKKKWARVAEEMCIPKTAHDRCTKLDDIYCKYLLPYDTLSPAERQKLFDSVEADWAKREAKARRHADKCVESSSNNDSEDGDENDEDENSESEENTGEGDGDMECIMKGRSMALSQFFRIARNTMSIWFKSTEPSSAEIEAEFWRHVAVRDSHVCVHSGSIDSSGWGYGFPTPGPKTKGSPCAKHPWNLKVLTNNNSSILRSLGPVMGVTVPTLHVGMLFSACCWYRDPHGLPWIEYLHTGGSKIWYGIPDDQNHNFRAAVTNLVPTHCQNKTIWLPCDTMMIPPHMLTDRSVSLSRTEQKPGEFVMVFPRAYTSSVGTGYTVSESVYFASNMWLDTAKQDFEVSEMDQLFG